MPTLSHERARAVYDRIGRLQDTQSFYEDRAVAEMVRHADFGRARRVFELGCGTGRLAERLLAEHLPGTATYRGVDLSPRMVEIARERLRPWATRAEVALTDGDPPANEPSGAYDRFVSAYVLDLLPESEIEAVLDEAHRILAPGGRLALVSLTTGTGPFSRLVARAWSRIHALRPTLLGGCRPVELRPRLDARRWKLLHHARLASFGVPSEVVVAERREEPGGARSA